MNSTFTTAMDGSVQPFAAAWGCQVARVARVGLMLLVLAGWAITSAYAAPDDNGEKIPRLAVKSTSEAPLTLNYTATPAECSECQGGVVKLTLRYEGTGNNLKVSGKKKTDKIFFNGPIPASKEITLVGDKSDGKFSDNNLLFEVDGNKVAIFHVSCSEEIGPGTTDQSGGKHKDLNDQLDFTVLMAFSRDGDPSLVCPAPPPGSCQECDGGLTSLTLSYVGPDDATITVEVSGKKNKKDKDGGTVIEIFSATDVDSGDEFTIPSDQGVGEKFSKNDLTIRVNGVAVAVFHVSCSADIIPGFTNEENDSKGKHQDLDDDDEVDETVFTITAATSKKGGLVSGSPGCDCVADTGPPVVSYSFVFGPDGTEGTPDDRLRIDFSDPAGVDNVDIEIEDADNPGAIPTLFFVESNCTNLTNTDNLQQFDCEGMTNAFVEYGFVDFQKNTLVVVTATDVCDNVSCPDDSTAPSVALNMNQVCTVPGFGDFPFACVDPDGVDGTDRFGTDFFVQDDVGVEFFTTFRLNNVFECQFFETGVVPSVGDGTFGNPYECPAPQPMSPLTFAPPKVQFNFIVAAINPQQGGTFGGIAADACNAYVIDPTVGAVSKHGGYDIPAFVQAETEVPVEFALDQNYPNPFNPATQIRFSLPEAGDVRLVVYDVLGRVVQVLVEGRYEAGHHAVTFDATSLSSGTYFYRLEAASQTMVRQMLLTK